MSDSQSSPDIREQVEAALLRIREGEATTDEVAALHELLSRDAEARRVYLRARQMDCLLESVPAAALLRPEEVTSVTGVSWRWKAFSFASAAAVVLLAAVLWMQNAPRDAGVQAVAVLRASYEAVIDGREVLPGELPMRAGTYRLERGSVQLRFAKGANVVIEGPAMFDLVDASTMHLNQGSVWAHCPEEARGFAVRMPGGRELVDFGTEFGARVDAVGGAQVKVMQGEVKIRDAVARTLDLTEGEAAHWEVTAPPLAVNAATVKPFQSEQMLAEKVKSAPALDQQTVVSFRDGKGGEWNRGENWSSGALPGAHALERAVINQSRVVRVLPGLPPPLHPVDIHVSNGPPPHASPDGTLEIRGDLECAMLRIATANGAHGVVRQTGGTVSVTGSLLAASHDGAPVRGDYALSDGALNVGHVIAIGRRGLSEFTLQGSHAVVTADVMSIGAHAKLIFMLDSTGAPIIKLRNKLACNKAAKLVIDGSQYRGGAQVIPLVLCGSSFNDQGQISDEQVSFEGFAGVAPRIEYRADGIDLVIDEAR